MLFAVSFLPHLAKFAKRREGIVKVAKNTKTSQPQPQTGSTPATETVVQERPAHIDSGDEARGETNSRANQTRTQPEPDPAQRAIGTVVALRTGGKKPKSLKAAEAEVSEQAKASASLESEARQRLAEANDLFGKGEEFAAEAQAVLDKGLVLLHNARVNNLMSADHLTALLGDQYGFKHKDNPDESVPAGHPKASKTPFKRGEAIRKRIVRSVQAHQYINGGETSKFFDGLPQSDVAAVLNGMTSGDIGFWNAYERLGAIKREHDAARVRLDPAFDPKRVAAMAEKLAEEGAATALANNEALKRAYVALYEMVEVAFGRLDEIQKAA
jgi:hypothetical protein